MMKDADTAAETVRMTIPAQDSAYASFIPEAVKPRRLLQMDIYRIYPQPKADTQAVRPAAIPAQINEYKEIRICHTVPNAIWNS